MCGDFMNNEGLIKCLEGLQQAQDTIDSLNAEIEELKNSKKCQSLLSYIQGSIYRPVKVFSKQPKCGKCNSNGMIPVKDEFFTRYVDCDCQKLKFEYQVQKLDVVSTSYIDDTDDVTYDCVVGNDLISVAEKYLCDRFDNKHLALDSKDVFYKNEEDCKKFVEEKTNEN